MYVCMHACMHVCMYVIMYVRLYCMTEIFTGNKFEELKSQNSIWLIDEMLKYIEIFNDL